MIIDVATSDVEVDKKWGNRCSPTSLAFLWLIGRLLGKGLIFLVSHKNFYHETCHKLIEQCGFTMQEIREQKPLESSKNICQKIVIFLFHFYFF